MKEGSKKNLQHQGIQIALENDHLCLCCQGFFLLLPPLSLRFYHTAYLKMWSPVPTTANRIESNGQQPEGGVERIDLQFGEGRIAVAAF